jgi:hypothetical protein
MFIEHCHGVTNKRHNLDEEKKQNYAYVCNNYPFINESCLFVCFVVLHVEISQTTMRLAYSWYHWKALNEQG